MYLIVKEAFGPNGDHSARERLRPGGSKTRLRFVPGGGLRPPQEPKAALCRYLSPSETLTMSLIDLESLTS